MMVLVFASIPIMLFVVAIAVVPGIVAMRIEALERRRAQRLVKLPEAPKGKEELPLAA